MTPPFRNLHPHPLHRVRDVLRWKLRLAPPESAPELLVPATGQAPRPVSPDLQSLRHPDPGVLQLTWIGHASFLLQHAGRSLLIDPVFSEFCSPLPLPGLRRQHPPGVAFADLPRIDAVLLTHNHYDHLDLRTLRRLPSDTPIAAPHGLGRWLRRRGFGVVTEARWWESRELAPGLTAHCCPAQHFSARGPHDRDRSLWCGWLLESGGRTVYHAGDSGYCPVFREIGSRWSPIEVALLPIGAYRPRWLMRAVHMDPPEAVQAHRDLGARVSVAMHWGAFRLTDEPPGEPAHYLAHARAAAGLGPEDFRVLAPGETLRRPPDEELARPAAGPGAAVPLRP